MTKANKHRVHYALWFNRHRVRYATWLNKSRVHCHYFDRTKSLYLAGTLVVRLERLGLLGGELLATFYDSGRPDVGGVLSTDGSASQVKVVRHVSSSDVLCCAFTLFHQCPQLRTICHPVFQQPLPSSTTYRRA